MGFWHTTHSSITLDDFRPELYKRALPKLKCAVCGKEFALADDLRSHRFSEHQTKRPLLIIRGHELGAAEEIYYSRINAEEIFMEHADKITFNDEIVSRMDFIKKICAITDDVAEVKLYANGVIFPHKIRIKVALEDHLKQIEAEILRLKILTLDSISLLIKSCQKYSTALPYCDGLSRFLYGLEKLERIGTQQGLEDGYINDFQDADNLLRNYNRPMANLARSLIAFHFNHFEVSLSLFGKGKVSKAAYQLLSCLDLEPFKCEDTYTECEAATRAENLFIDKSTALVLRTSEAYETFNTSEIEQEIKNMCIPNYDKLKLSIMLSCKAFLDKNYELVKKHAGSLRGDPNFGTWAEKIVISTLQAEKQNAKS